jgi:hypothetical protein
MTFADRGTIRRRARPYAAGLGAVLIAAGCTAGAPTPNASTAVPSTESSSATPTVSPSVTTTTTKPTPTVDPVIAKIPAAARPETMAGAEAFARFYVGQVNEAYTQGDPSPLQGLSTSACKTCAVFIETATGFREEGLRHDAPSLHVTSATATSFTDRRQEVTAFVTQSPVNVEDARGTKRSRTSAAKGAFLITLAFDSHWRVTRLQTAKS